MDTPAPHLGRVVIAGGAGFLGRSLTRELAPFCQEVVILTRGQPQAEGNVRHVHWDARTLGPWATELEGATAVVNYVGRTVNCRKTPENKRVILESRVNSVHALGAAMKTCTRPPPVWVQSATAHIYGDTGDELLDESSPIGTGFAPDVGAAWERALAEEALPRCRQVVLRISFVVGRGGGALQTLSRLTKWGLGGTTGTGRQWMSWVHESDLNAVVLRAIQDESMSGVYVVTSPNPVTNAEFMRLLRRSLHRPWSPRVPEPMVRLGAWMMRTDPELALLGRRCVPTRLTKEGFVFKYPSLDVALLQLFSK
jgi:uncharacterized protein (TIGR01777 family)